MRPAIAETPRARRVQEHLADRIEIGIGVVEQRSHDERPTVVLHQEFEVQLIHISTGARGAGGDAVGGIRLVIRRVAKGVGPRRVEELQRRGIGVGRFGDEAGSQLWVRP